MQTKDKCKMKRMSEYKYFCGMQVRGYPSYKQTEKVKFFGGSSEFVHNRLVDTNNRLYALRQTGIYLKPVADEIRSLEKYLTHKGLVNACPFLKDVDSMLIANARQNYQKAWRNFMSGRGNVPTFHKKKNYYKYQTNPHYEHVANQRRDFFFKLANELCKKYDVIAIEDLNLKGMQSLWGRKESDLAYGEFVSILEYVAASSGKHIVKIDRRAPSTKTCSACGAVESIPITKTEWICPSCGTHHDRDINAAINILDIALTA